MKTNSEKRLKSVGATIAILIAASLALLAFGRIDLAAVFAAEGDTVAYTSGGSYVVSENITADCKNLPLLAAADFTIKPSVTDVTFVGSEFRRMMFKYIEIESRTTELTVRMTNMWFVGPYDGNTIKNNNSELTRFIFSGKNEIEGGLRQSRNPDATQTDHYCNAIQGGDITIEGSGTIVIAGGAGLANQAQGGIGFFGNSVSVYTDATIKGGNGAPGLSGAAGGTGGFPGGNGGNGTSGANGGDSRPALLLVNAPYVAPGVTLTLVGGDGGDGGRGGDGGKGGNGKNGALFVSPIGGGDGGSGGKGGDGGAYAGTIMPDFKAESYPGTGRVFFVEGRPGNGGNGGNGGSGGNGSYSMYGNPKNNAGQGGSGGIGGRGGKNFSNGGIDGASGPNGFSGSNGLNDPKKNK